MKRSFQTLLILLFTTALPALATESVQTAAGLALPVDNSGASARATALGGAFVGVADDSSALFWNAAGLGSLENMQAAFNHNSGLVDQLQETAVFALPLGSLGGAAASFDYLSYGSFAGRDSFGNPTGSYFADDLGFSAGWGRQWLKGLYGGLALRLTSQSLADQAYTVFSGDISALWQPLAALRVGFSYNNLGTGEAGYSQASALRLGASYLWDVDSQNQLLIAAGSSLEPGGVSRLQAGLEETYLSFVIGRVGYNQSLADTQLQGLSGLTLGLGFKYRGFLLDYAFLPYGDLGSSNRISLSYVFEAQKPAKAKNKKDQDE